MATSTGLDREVTYFPNGIATGAKEFNVQNYGMKGDGITDSRPGYLRVVAAALANLPAVIYFPPGDYNISDGVEVLLAQGEGGLTLRGDGPDVARIVLTGTEEFGVGGRWFAMDIKPSVTPTIGVYADYIHDVTVEGLGFYDDDPTAHADVGVEETHAISIKYCRNATVDNCKIDSIGDEGISFGHVIGGRIRGNATINTPSVGADSAALTITAGCQDISVSSNVVHSSDTLGTQSTVGTNTSKGISVELVTADDVHGIHIVGNSIRDCGDEGVLVGIAAAADAYNIEIMANTITNCGIGIGKTGTLGLLNGCTVMGNTLVDIQGFGMDFGAGKTNIFDIVVSGNLIDTVTSTGMRLNCTRAQLIGNAIKDGAGRGFHVVDGEDITIMGGSIVNTGGSSLEDIEVEAGTNILIDSVQVLDSNSSFTCIKAQGADVRNCIVDPGALTTPENTITNFYNATGNKVTGGLRPANSSPVPGVVANNTLKFSDVGSAGTSYGISLLSGVSDMVISGNNIDLSGSTNNQPCIIIASGSNNNLITGNQVRSKTAGVANSISDSGTGTLADMTIANITS